jgi:hypothetical protein
MSVDWCAFLSGSFFTTSILLVISIRQSVRLYSETKKLTEEVRRSKGK